MVTACFAATMGCTVGTCEVAATMMFRVACASPAAQV